MLFAACIAFCHIEVAILLLFIRVNVVREAGQLMKLTDGPTAGPLVQHWFACVIRQDVTHAQAPILLISNQHIQSFSSLSCCGYEIN